MTEQTIAKRVSDKGQSAQDDGAAWLKAMGRIIRKGESWDADREATLIKVARWAIIGMVSFAGLSLAEGIALAQLAPLRRDIPYVVKVDTPTGNLEVLQAFDSRVIPKQELLDKYWTTKYVQAREQYNWWLVGGDYDLVSRLSDPSIRSEYTKLFDGPDALDKAFGSRIERKIRILSVAPAPTVVNEMLIRFERITTQDGRVVEHPTRFLATLQFKYLTRIAGPEIDLIRNPMGYDVFAYRVDPEVSPVSADASASEPSSAGGAK